jgi:hypothetical protein
MMKFDLKNKLSTMAVRIDILSDSCTSDMTTELLELIQLLGANVDLLPEIEDALKAVTSGPLFNSSDL